MEVIPGLSTLTAGTVSPSRPPVFVEPQAHAWGRAELVVSSERRAYQLYAHITWHTYRRVDCLDSLATRDVMDAVEKACVRCAVRVLRTAVLSDHVHLLVSYKPSTRLSDFVRVCKAGSSYMANKRVFGALKWAKGYYVGSVSRRDLSQVDRYIANQFDRHRDRIPRHRLPSHQPPA